MNFPLPLFKGDQPHEATLVAPLIASAFLNIVDAGVALLGICGFLFLLT